MNTRKTLYIWICEDRICSWRGDNLEPLDFNGYVVVLCKHVDPNGLGKCCKHLKPVSREVWFCQHAK